ncbi:MAG: glutamate--cysteine ligase [Gammaproteobacteria bacterium]|nr:glutamate--cysteine ligase [Gammaproteobacteria bacterium]MBT4493096.1 glutamate--cysteine ligase [Gammaproteobacteria bacterium]MBT7372216.1 glutamate--cysteine ligase [Gammaproteobacteria bacterium]
MKPDLLNNLDKAQRSHLLTFNHGIEREALRVTPSGSLALTDHPGFLGSKLTHPKITTDFSESQLELITPVHRSAQAALEDLDLVHRYIYTGLDDEILWSASMPCVLQTDEEIPLAHYGTSNLGRLKTTYRSGLGCRYGRGMQTICAVHYNFSFSNEFWQWLKGVEGSSEPDRDFITRRYFDLMRNFRRMSWLLTYLFGASPAVCNSFLSSRQHSLEPFDDGTAYLPHATSLRSGDLGYQSDAQGENMKICYNSLSNYVGTLASAICTTYAPYEKIGTKVDGEYRQINTSILQSEAEFYSSIRAKRVPGKGENFLARLLEDGVEYIEVRLLDVNPYLPLGIDQEQIDFLDAFLINCLLSDSPEHDETRCQEVRENTMKTVHGGRSAGLMLTDNGTPRSFHDWGSEILNEVSGWADQLDQAHGTTRYTDTTNRQKSLLMEPVLTPSGSILADMAKEQIPFFRFAMDKALAHRDHFLSRPPTQEETDLFEAMATKSVTDQQDIEAADTVSFDEYLQNILQEYRPLAE